MDPWLIDSFQNRPQGIPRMNRGLKKGSSLVSSRVAFMLCGGRLAAGAAACGLHSPAGALRGSLWSQRGNGAASSSTGIVAGDVGGANHPRMQVAGRSFHGSGSPLREEAKKKKGMFYELGVIFSKERAAERRAALKEEITRGQFHEIKELDKTGGKIFDANLDLIPEYESVVFPNFDAKTLDNKHVNAHQVLGGKVSLVTVSLREIARPMVNTWTTHFHSKHGSHPNAQIVPVSFVEGMVYKWFSGSMLSGMKKMYTEEQKQHAMVAFQSSEAFRKTFDMKNRLLGYAFLVDQNRKVRWRGVGYALHHEGKALTDCANKLLNVR